MNPGTFYLYEYENCKRRRNVGFIKVTRHYQSCILQIQAKGVPVRAGRTLGLYAFFCEQNRMNSAQIADLTSCGRNISIRLPVSEIHFPERRSLQQIDGFFLRLPEDNRDLFWMASSFFFDVKPDMIQFPSPKAESTPPEEASPESQPDADRQPTKNTPDNAPEPSKLQSELPELQAPLSEAESEPTAASTPVSQEESASVPPKRLEPVPQEESMPASQEEPAIESAEAKDLPQAKKISRSDLTLLPRKFWPLANNSFLLHGYHNYNHLALIEEGGRKWLGVPGIYDTREARAADLFGFPRFTRAYVSVLELTDEERNDTADFGHWCRCVGTCSPDGTPPASSGNSQTSPAPDSRLK